MPSVPNAKAINSGKEKSWCCGIKREGKIKKSPELPNDF